MGGRGAMGTRKFTGSTSLGSWGLTEFEPPTRELAWDITKSSAYFLQCVVWSSCEASNSIAGMVTDCTAFPPTELPYSLLIGEEVPSLICDSCLIYMGVLAFCEE